MYGKKKPSQRRHHHIVDEHQHIQVRWRLRKSYDLFCIRSRSYDLEELSKKFYSLFFDYISFEGFMYETILKLMRSDRRKGRWPDHFLEYNQLVYTNWLNDFRSFKSTKWELRSKVLIREAIDL
jgi:hypothetical protein